MAVYRIPISTEHAKWYKDEARTELDYLATLDPGNPNQTADMLVAVVGVLEMFFSLFEFVLTSPVDRGDVNPGPPAAVLEVLRSMIASPDFRDRRQELKARLALLVASRDRRGLPTSDEGERE